METSSGCYTGEGSAISDQLIVRVRNTAAMTCLQQMKIKGDALRGYGKEPSLLAIPGSPTSHRSIGMAPVVSHKAKGIYLVYDVLAALLSAMMIALSVTDPEANLRAVHLNFSHH